jgi:hypothetical protein
MEEFVAKMADKVGISEETAMKVVEFLKEHADEVPALLAKTGLEDKLPDAVKGLF